jgi:hypothetical protein
MVRRAFIFAQDRVWNPQRSDQNARAVVIRARSLPSWPYWFENWDRTSIQWTSQCPSALGQAMFVLPKDFRSLRRKRVNA